jgi:toxin-antitoxin system PIN domain toxin
MKKASSNLLLLDLNVLLALAWPTHPFHAVATRRMNGSRERWATCAITQLGFIRISSAPSANPDSRTPAEAAALLARMTGDPLHLYLDSLPPPAERWMQRALGTKQVTDAYLLALAEFSGATFLTFDTKLKVLGGSTVKTEVLIFPALE